MKQKRLYIAEIVLCAATVILLYAATYSIGMRLMPPRNDYGATWNAYLQEPEDSVDVMFFGSSRAYCNVIPAELYRQTGLTSYVMAGPVQTPPLTYYYLRECLKTQSPRCIFVEASGMFYEKYREHSKSNVCYMPLSRNKVMAAAECEKGILMQALFPIITSHYRVYQPRVDNPDLLTTEDGILLAGYTCLKDTRKNPSATNTEPQAPVGSAQYAENLAWFQKIADLCQERNISLYFFISPSLLPVEQSQRDALCRDLQACGADGVADYTGLDVSIGIDSEREWYDANHFLFPGAVKFSDHLAQLLPSCVEDAENGADPALWQRRVEYLDGLTADFAARQTGA